MTLGSNVREQSGAPTVGAFTGGGGSPIVVDSATGRAYTLKTGDVVVPMGTATSIAATQPSGLLTVGGSPITTSGTLAFAWSGTTGGVPYFSSDTSLTTGSLTFDGAVLSAPAAIITVVAAIGGLFAPTARLHLAAGTTAAGTAPLKFTAGTALTAPESLVMEPSGDKLLFTIPTGTARKEITLNDAALTSGRIPTATTNGRLTDGPIPVADGTYAFATASGKVASLTTTKGLVTAIVVTP